LPKKNGAVGFKKANGAPPKKKKKIDRGRGGKRESVDGGQRETPRSLDL